VKVPPERLPKPIVEVVDPYKEIADPTLVPVIVFPKIVLLNVFVPD
jgi:hypothetical protein